MNKVNKVFSIIILGVFIILFCAKVFQHGLFFDGLIYSSISQNLADGLGSFWQPQFSQTIYPAFFEHPPLVFKLQSGFMSLFDGAFFAEKLYGCFMALTVVVLMALIWMKIAKTAAQKQLFWLPVFCWIITPKNSWAFGNNMLENTMTVFSLASVYLLIVTVKLTGTKRIAGIFAAAICLFLAFLSKGFPGLFPLAFFGLYFLLFKSNYSIKRMLKDTAILFISTAVIFFLFFFFNSAAQDNLITYIDTQVLGSITGKNRVGSRLVLMKNLFNELIPIIIIILIFVGVFWKKAKQLITKTPLLKQQVFLFLVIGLSASVPMMVSLKISSFYLITALPYFAMAGAFLLAPFVLHIVEKLGAAKIGFNVLRIIAVFAIAIGIGLTALNTGGIGRDHETFNDMEEMESFIQPNT
ncbi:MAG: hypothetical protein JKY22_00095, partial [Flavobacteriaceae bacterium]|nr:hypothetical protein [Flavobacteriaceae bacterium]